MFQATQERLKGLSGDTALAGPSSVTPVCPDLERKHATFIGRCAVGINMIAFFSTPEKGTKTPFLKSYREI